MIAVDVGNNTYSFGRFFECRGRQDVLMSGYLGSIGFGSPGGDRRVGRRCAGEGSGRKVVSISGDGGFGQYLAELTTAVKYGFPLTHVVLNNGELAKISREQLGAIRPVWQTNLVNPDFAEYARLCGAAGVLGAHAGRPAPGPGGGAWPSPTARRWSRSTPHRRTCSGHAAPPGPEPQAGGRGAPRRPVRRAGAGAVAAGGRRRGLLRRRPCRSG